MKRKIASLILLVCIAGCSKKDDNTVTNETPPISNENTQTQVNDKTNHSSLEEDITALLEGKSYINLCSVSISTSSTDTNKITFDIVVIGDNLKSNLQDMLEVFAPNSDKIDWVNSIIKDDTGSQIYPKSTIISTDLPDGSLSDWNLILLNHDDENKIDKDLNFEQVKFDTQYVDARAGVYYQQMYDAALKDGITLYLRSGFRNISTQTVNYNANIDRLKNQGLTYEQAVIETNLYYTVPGHSEHHTGLAFDIITPEYHRDIYTLSDEFAKTDAYDWLIANCAEYGFILRYAEDKTDITAINFEPWHYRYVGKEHAEFIMENDICLEEYIQLLKDDGR